MRTFLCILSLCALSCYAVSSWQPYLDAIYNRAQTAAMATSGCIESCMTNVTYSQLVGVYGLHGCISQSIIGAIGFAPRACEYLYDESILNHLHQHAHLHIPYTKFSCTAAHRNGAHVANILLDMYRISNIQTKTDTKITHISCIAAGAACGLYTQRYVEPHIRTWIRDILTQYTDNRNIQDCVSCVATPLITWIIEQAICIGMRHVSNTANTQAHGESFSVGISLGCEFGDTITDNAPYVEIERAFRNLQMPRSQRST